MIFKLLICLLGVYREKYLDKAFINGIMRLDNLLYKKSPMKLHNFSLSEANKICNIYHIPIFPPPTLLIAIPN